MGDVVTQILEDAKALSDLDIRRAEMGMDAAEKRVRVLGTVHSDDTRRLWAVGHWYAGQSARAMLAATFECATKDEADDLNLKGQRLRKLGSLAVEMFWAEARNDIGGSAWTMDIGVRQGWIVIAQPAKSKSPLAQLLGHVEVEEE